MEDSFRQVRGFVQRLETGRQGTFHARFGPDLMALRDGSANVVVREGLTLTADEGEALAHLRPPAAGVTGTGSHVTGTGGHAAGTGSHGTGTGPFLRPPSSMTGTGSHVTGTGGFPRTAVLDQEISSRARVRLVLSQPPIHWSPENLAFAYLATALAMGMEPTLGLPLDLVFEAPPRVENRSEWARDAVDMRRSLDGVRPHMETDGTAVLLLDRQPSAAVVASVLGAVGAGFRLRDAIFAEGGTELTGAVELTLPGGAPPVDRGIRDPAGPDASVASPVGMATGPFRRDELEAAIAELAVAVLQARGEPARYERLLGEVLLGLDRSGHLQRVTSLWPDLTRPAEPLPVPPPPEPAPEPVIERRPPGARAASAVMARPRPCGARRG